MIDESELSRIADTIIVVTFFAFFFSIVFYAIIDAVMDFIDRRKLKKAAREAREAKETESAKTNE